MAKGARPVYDVSVMNKKTGVKGRVGAAWLGDNGSISIKLNPCVVLPADPDMLIMLFPIDWTADGRRSYKDPSFSTSDEPKRGHDPASNPGSGDMDDPIPF